MKEFQTAVGKGLLLVVLSLSLVMARDKQESDLDGRSSDDTLVFASVVSKHSMIVELIEFVSPIIRLMNVFLAINLDQKQK